MVWLEATNGLLEEMKRLYEEWEGQEFEERLWKSIECVHGGEMCEDRLVQGLVRLVLHVVSRSLSTAEMKALFADLGFSASDTDTTLRVYQQCWTDLVEIVRIHQTARDPSQHVRFGSAQWRVEVETGSRFVKHANTLNCLLGITLGGVSQEGVQEPLWIDCDPANLAHLEHSLAQALAEAQLSHNTRFLRSL